jgi:peptidoglycan/LPS O-acetylase OafA/YrhL
MDRSEIAPLTGLRAFAALAVVLYNHRQVIQDSLPGYPGAAGSHGYLGVDVFFVLSGFVLALNYGGRLRGGRDYFEFVGYRVARLYPLHIFTLAAVLAMAHTAMALGLTVHSPHRFQIDSQLLLHALMLHSWGFETELRYNLPSWSISAEFFAYLLFPLFWAVAARFTRPRLAGIAALAALGASILILRELGHPNLDVATKHTLIRVSGAFLAGCLVYRARVLGGPAPRWAETLLLLGSIGVALSPWADPLMPIAACGLIYALAGSQKSLLARPFALGFVVWLGRISYSIYLVHLPVASVLNRVSPLLLGPGRTAWGGAALLALDAVLVIGIAAACYYAVEVPGRRILRQRVRRLAGYPA